MVKFIQRRHYTPDEVERAIELVRRTCPNEFALLKHYEVHPPADRYSIEPMWAAFYKDFHDIGMSSNLSEGGSLVFQVRKAARREVGLPVEPGDPGYWES